MTVDLDARPGFRRRFRITPDADRVTAAVEDDYHCMVVALYHDGHAITRVEGQMERWPWTTCPGAPAVLAETFTGAVLAEAAARGMKQANCTHLYDLAIFAAAHASDADALIYDVFVSDPVEGRKYAEIRKGGAVILTWTLENDVVQEPAALQGTHVMKLREWIGSLSPADKEAARVLQWASLIAHGREIPLSAQSDATRMPPNCFTFQPDRAKIAERIGKVLDFSGTARRPLDHFDGRAFALNTGEIR